MPMLKARDASTGHLLDLTDMTDTQKDDLHGKRNTRQHGYEPICDHCQRYVYQVCNHHHTRFFRHAADGGDCIYEELNRSGGSESPEHLAGKYRVAKAIRSLTGWEANVELVYLNGDACKVDVDARYLGEVRHQGQGHFGWEVQLSHLPAGEFTRRSQNIQRLAGSRPVWMTPFAHSIGENVAMICDPTVETITDRLLLQYSPDDVALPATAIADVIKGVHRRAPKYRWFQRGDEYGRQWYVADINAFRVGPPTDHQRPRPRISPDSQHEECERDPIPFIPFNDRYTPCPKCHQVAVQDGVCRSAWCLPFEPEQWGWADR